MAAPTLTTLPDELLRPLLLGSVDSRKQLTSLRLVSRRFHAIADPEFWRTIVLEPHTAPRRVEALVQALQRNPSNGDLVRSLIIFDNVLPEDDWPVDEPGEYIDISSRPSLQWFFSTYDSMIGRFLDRIFRRSRLTSSHVLLLLIAHMPQLEHLSFTAPPMQLLSPLVYFFDLCRPARLRYLGGTAGPVTVKGRVNEVDKTPLRHLDRLCFFRCKDYGFSMEFPSIMPFPALHMQIHAGSLCRLDHLQPCVQVLEVRQHIFDPQVVPQLLARAPSLQNLVYDAIVLRLFHLGHPQPQVVDLRPISNALRKLGAGLTHINLSIHFDADARGCTLQDSVIGALRSLKVLKTLAITPAVLLGDEEQTSAPCRLADMLPTSLELLHLAQSRPHDGMGECGWDTAADLLQHVLFVANPHELPNLVGIKVGRVLGETRRRANESGWKNCGWKHELVAEDHDPWTWFGNDGLVETKREPWMWFARAGADEGAVLRRLGAGDMQFVARQTADWGACEDDSAAFQALSGAS
ncbi:hypothetical protein Micbo1qcDRAFT_209121 [Microdochium bolleyi]|uniref:F-box domain-containing protein n=1 Tax=Microdochium bolleyi TaxID=196109 RepID=A0A136INB3_9PEZI|nr:hypothetical protein Micbo1qcDRAFT_209121 [Microdochium bolleyi]